MRRISVISISIIVARIAWRRWSISFPASIIRRAHVWVRGVRRASPLRIEMMRRRFLAVIPIIYWWMCRTCSCSCCCSANLSFSTTSPATLSMLWILNCFCCIFFFPAIFIFLAFVIVVGRTRVASTNIIFSLFCFLL